MFKNIHATADADSRGGIKLKCTLKWESVGKGDGKTSMEGVYKLETGNLYTFTDSKVSCDKCRSCL